MSAAYWITGDTRSVVDQLAAAGVVVDLVLTSPPFLALRSYLPDDHPDKAAEIGSEPTPAAFIDTMLELTAGWRSILAPHGSIAVELGDTYAGSGGAGGDYGDDGLRAGQTKFDGSARTSRGRDSAAGTINPKTRNTPAGWPEDKSLTMIPESYRLGLAYGINPLTGDTSPAGRWRVRNVVRWVRPNPPVGALGDKFRPATSDMAIACVSRTRWFDLDAVRQPLAAKTLTVADGTPPSAKNMDSPSGHHRQDRLNNPAGAPPLDWWSISPGGYSGSHYAVFPAELCIRPIEAMCPRRVCRTCGEPSRRLTETEQLDTGRTTNGPQSIDRKHIEGGSAGFATRTESRSTTTGWTFCGCAGIDPDGIRQDGYHDGPGWRPGIVLDPFGGSGTTGMVATGHGRDAILIDLDERNLELAHERLGMFLTETTATGLGALLNPVPSGAAS